jgi:hypothetical protein
MNLGMRAKTRDDAFVEAFAYYIEHLSTVTSKYNNLKSKVDSSVKQFAEDDDDDYGH